MQQEQEEEEMAAVVIDRAQLTPSMRHYLQMSKLHSQNAYTAGDAKTMEKNEFTKTFCEQETGHKLCLIISQKISFFSIM
jgi:hypothetical protein